MRDAEAVTAQRAKQPAAPAEALPQAPPPPPAGPIASAGASNAQVAETDAMVVTDAAEPKALLPPVEPHLQGRKCLVLDLDETLVHSSFKVGSPPLPPGAGDRCRFVCRR